MATTEFAPPAPDAGPPKPAPAESGTGPYTVKNDPQACSVDMPWSVSDSTDKVMGCHATEQDANAHAAALQEAEDQGTSPKPGTTQGPAQPQAAEAEEFTEAEPFAALLAIEGHLTADGRMFELDSLTWRDMPLPLMVQTENNYGHDGAWFGGSIEDIQRDPTEPSRILATGHFAGPRAAEAADYVRAGLHGISVDVSGEDVMVEEMAGEEGKPGSLVERFQDGRIMGAAVCGMPAFEETVIWLTNEAEAPPRVTSVAGGEVPHGEEIDGFPMFLLGSARTTMGAVQSHSTGTSDATWDGPANEARLPSPMSRATAQNAYAWISPDATGDQLNKTDARFIHHNVGQDGTPGAANLTAASTGIGVLHGGRGGSTIPQADQKGVYDHLARHLRDGGLEPPPFALIAACGACEPGYEPPRWHFDNPDLDAPTAWRIDEDGHIFGHVAIWGTCHTGSGSGRCVQPPHSHADYDYFLQGSVHCSDNSWVRVGQITMNTGHDNDLTAPAAEALAHYDNTGLAVADVCVGEDRHGIWCSGHLRPHVTAEMRSALQAAKPSGDWRPIGPGLELIAVLAVNVPGFPMPRARVASGAVTALVAAAAPVPEGVEVRLAHLEHQYAALARHVHEEALRRLDARQRSRDLQTLDRRVRGR